MKNILLLLFITISIMVLLAGCSKSSNPAPPPPPNPPNQDKCVVTKVASHDIRVHAPYKLLTFDNDGNLKMIKTFDHGGILLDSTIINVSIVTLFRRDGSAVRTEYFTDLNRNERANLFTGLPNAARVYVKLPSPNPGSIDPPFTLYLHYLFTYNTRKKLVKVGIDHEIGHDFALTISYDDKSNVKSFFYERTTGPRDPIPSIESTSYDDKPTPFGSIKSWVFLMNYSFEASDVEPLFMALSNNNPLNYNHKTTPEFTRTATYQYNEKGFPIERVLADKLGTSLVSYKESFEYNCK